MLAKRTFKNQVTIPKDVIQNFGDVEYFDVYYRNGEIVLRPVEIQSREERLDRIRSKIKALGLGPEDLHEAIQWARKS